MIVSKPLDSRPFGFAQGRPFAGFMFSRTIDFTDLVVGHGLEARATTAKMAVPHWYFARLNTHAPKGRGEAVLVDSSTSLGMTGRVLLECIESRDRVH